MLYKRSEVFKIYLYGDGYLLFHYFLFILMNAANTTAPVTFRLPIFQCRAVTSL